MNRITLIGRLTRDAIIYSNQDNKRWGIISIAVDLRGQEKNTLFIGVKIFNERILDNVVRYVGKGDLIGVDGYLSQSTYLDKNNNKKTVYEVVADSIEFLESMKMKKLKEEEERKNALFKGEEKDIPIEEINDDDLPF